MGRVTEEFVEVNHCVEDVCGANPAVERLTIGLGAFTRVVVVRAAIRCNGAAIDEDAVGVGSLNHLLKRRLEFEDKGIVDGLGMFFEAVERAEIVNAFEHDEEVRAGYAEDIAIEPRESVRAKSIFEDAVAADSLVDDAEMPGCKLLGEDVRPAIVGVGGGSVTVRDRVAERDDGGCILPGLDLESRDEVPVRKGSRRFERCILEVIAGQEERCGAGASVKGQRVGRPFDHHGDDDVR